MRTAFLVCLLASVSCLPVSSFALARNAKDNSLNEIVYKPQPPLSDPKANYPGLNPSETVLPKGYVFQPGRRPLSEPMIFDQDVAITLRDGTVIYADVYRPVGDTKVPAIVSYGPAGKRGQNNMLDIMGGKDGVPERMGIPRDATSGMQAYLSQDPAEWVPHGYAIVNVDMRGVYMSGGDLDYFGPRNGEDGAEVIEFIARQPWSTGKVGMSGNYWYGLTQWFVAAQRPPHLAAIAPWDAGSDIYVDEYVRDGIPVVDSGFRQRSFGPGRIEDLQAMVAKYPLRNAYWWSKVADYGKIDIPVYQTAVYTSSHTRGDFSAYGHLGTREKWLRVNDGQGWVDFYDPKNVADLRRFFDHYLKGENNGWESTPKVRLAVLDPGHAPIINRAEADFPLPDQVATPLYLSAGDGSLSLEPPRTVTQGSYDASSTDKLQFTYRFQEETEITGFLSLHLWVEAKTASDMDVFALVTKLDADGKPIGHDGAMTYTYYGPDGRLRVSQRALDKARSKPMQPFMPHEMSQPLHPGQIVPIDIQLWPTGMKFHKGEQLQLTISGHDYWISKPVDRPAPKLTNSGIDIIHTGGKYQSYLTIPVIPPRPEKRK